MLYVLCGLHLEPDRMFPKADMVNDFKYDPQAAAQKEGQLHEKLKEKRLEMVREMEMNEEMEKQQELEKEENSEMEELNKAMLKLAAIMEEDKAQSNPEPTAPEEVDLYSQELFPEPTAPPESRLFLDEDFHCEIEADAASTYLSGDE